jgi:alpha-L-rhamnosidase
MLGIETDGPGFKAIIMTPEFGAGVTWAKGHYDSIRGRIVSDWKIEGDSFRWTVTVPANTTAILSIPSVKPAEITEGGSPVKEVAGITHLRTVGGRSVLRVDAGTYAFLSKIEAIRSTSSKE